MRSIPNTVTEYPTEPHASGTHWVHYGHLAVFNIPSADPEVVKNIELVIDGILQPGPDDGHQPVLIPEEGVAIYSVVSRYTANADRLNEALANLSDHHGLPGVLWTSGPVHLGKHLQSGVAR